MESFAMNWDGLRVTEMLGPYATKDAGNIRHELVESKREQGSTRHELTESGREVNPESQL
eukprot:1894685-Amphidinium_carterae.1